MYIINKKFFLPSKLEKSFSYHVNFCMNAVSWQHCCIIALILLHYRSRVLICLILALILKFGFNYLIANKIINNFYNLMYHTLDLDNIKVKKETPSKKKAGSLKKLVDKALFLFRV